MFRRKHRKNITFSVPIKKGLDNGKTIAYKTKFIDNFRFMSNSLSCLVDNLSECNHNEKRTENYCLTYISTKDNQSIFECLKYKKNHNKDFKKDLIKIFENTYEFYEFCDGDINKFILSLRKEVYAY